MHNLLHVTKNRLTIDDSIIWAYPREMEYINLKKDYENFLWFDNFGPWENEPWFEAKFSRCLFS